MSKLGEEQENLERDRVAWNLPRPQRQGTLPEDLIGSLKQGAAPRTDEEASSRGRTQGDDEV
jgi:hypothetical protein